MSDITTGFARTDDGLQLYWRALGSGPPMVCCNGVGVSTFFWKYIAQHFRDRYRVILWDYRGHGLSTLPEHIPTADLSMGRNAADLAAVLADAGVAQPAIILGHSMGVQVMLQFAADYPDHVRALVPMFGTFARPLDTFLDFRGSHEAFKLIKKVANASGRGATRILLALYASPLAFSVGQITGMVDKYYAAKFDIDQYIDHLGEMNTDVFLGMVEHMADHDLTAFLPQITVPTLVFGGENDIFTPLHRSKKMAELIPDAELIVLAEGSHAAIVEHPATINRRIDRFLRERVDQAP